ncbi:hypothetical protein [Streptomyces sp. NEAU-W12]|uniref:hypothetical protein n=1 Tax=Streptomyces sp. NEAU-W12 TaxID=2994668 RepID=UPI00224AA1CF|nr:hypothetical protein [Streptomyces sp. NEAU-W12]MCX2928524.1 hypothetical protein [Streptomyces sp. NEAU-W12]
MKEAGLLAVTGLLAVWLLWSLRNLYRIPVGLCDGSWQRPLWWARLWSLALFVGFAAWLRGALSGGLDIGETCAYTHHQTYDGAYRSARSEEFRRLFPLHNKCNAEYDLVPGWVNPTVVNCAAFVLLATAVLLWFGIARLARGGGSRTVTERLVRVDPSLVTRW